MNNDTLKETSRLEQRFDESIQDLDAQTVSQITQARSRALAKYGKKTSRWLIIPAGAVAAACVFALVFVLAPDQKEANGIKEIDVELISSSDELELYEDLEFYEWLENYEASS